MRARTCSTAPKRPAGPTACTKRCVRWATRCCRRALERYADSALTDATDPARARLRDAYNDALDAVGPEAVEQLRHWPALARSATEPEYCYVVRGREVRGDNYTETLSHTQVPKLAVPKYRDWGDLLTFLLKENLPGHFPYTAGVYPYRREEEDPTRMFAGEGSPERTNRRFHYLAGGHGAARLSTAFDSTTLYGEDPDERPDIYGRIGNSGVSIATLDDMKKLYSGFDLCAPTTSVSMTINGPAPMILAMFMNTAVDQRVERYLREQGRWADAEKKIAAIYRGRERPTYKGELPAGHDGSGLGLLGVTGDQLLDRETYARIRAEALALVRGTVQADILKEDQAQNTCIFSTEFALRMMGDVQQFFTDNNVRNFYSVSISGYHIAEAGANPISQLAFTLANGFTIVEYYLARGMKIDDFAPNLSFFFSNGMDPEYAVIGRVARRIWARAMRDLYGGGPRSQMLKYHIQTSGRSLHAREIQFNDTRTTLQALYALFDNCNSLHTNAYDEAITTPTEESVRRAVAIQLIINKELGLNKTQNPWQGSFAVEELTDMVEEAVYRRVRADLRAWRRARRDGDDVPAEPDPGREPVLRDHEARRTAADHRRQHLPRRRGRWSRDPRRGAHPLDRGREAAPGALGTRIPRAQRRAQAGGAEEPAVRRCQRRQRLRRADGDGQGRVARQHLARAVPGGRSVPAQHVTARVAAGLVASRGCSLRNEDHAREDQGEQHRRGAEATQVETACAERLVQEVSARRRPAGGSARRPPRTARSVKCR